MFLIAFGGERPKLGGVLLQLSNLRGAKMAHSFQCLLGSCSWLSRGDSVQRLAKGCRAVVFTNLMISIWPEPSQQPTLPPLSRFMAGASMEMPASRPAMEIPVPCIVSCTFRRSFSFANWTVTFWVQVLSESRLRRHWLLSNPLSEGASASGI